MLVSILHFRRCRQGSVQQGCELARDFRGDCLVTPNKQASQQLGWLRRLPLSAGTAGESSPGRGSSQTRGSVHGQEHVLGSTPAC
jgi:hypothetical protein